MAELSIHTAQICAEAQILFHSSEHSNEWKHGLLEIIKDATAIDLLYQSWIEENSSSGIWRYQTFYLSPDEALPVDGMVQVHHDLYTAYIWSSCRGKRAHSHGVSLHCLSLLGCHPEATNLYSKLISLGLAEDLVTRSNLIIEDMVSDICAAVPFMLGDIDSVGKLAVERKRTPLAGYFLLWPLHVARANTSEGSEMEAWIRKRFDIVDNEMGIRFGRFLANKIRKVPWDLS